MNASAFLKNFVRGFIYILAEPKFSLKNECPITFWGRASLSLIFKKKKNAFNLLENNYSASLKNMEENHERLI